jgi:predicted RNA binding protein YcfA (HicA-like mRNA interferase family)
MHGHRVKRAALIRELRAAGWVLDRIRGSHHVFRHPARPGHVVVPHPKKDLGVGLVAAIRRQAGL